ncbi:MAG: beta-galactosidase [Defluviitaleaceae bacterium]|nr:beta-galactosidase [Defluviitaleaceae bacterium]
MKKLLYGCAYYYEYMPYERLHEDMRMIKEAGMNVIRIAESTWSNHEPQEGVFEFSHVTKVIEAAAREGLSVIIGTPTYAIPPWMAARYPDVIADTGKGREKYGRRQNMDITSPIYLFFAERVIRKLMSVSLHYPNVIGVQLDNETKHYGTCGPNVQRKFVQHLRDTFGTTDAMNRAFGFNYWSNRVDSWENVPDVTGAVNGSFRAEFEKFRRGLVTEFLEWQNQIVREFLRDDQFITHNFDYEWRDHSFGIQPDVNHKQTSRAITLTGCDIYHPSQDLLTGVEIAFCGAAAYGLKRQNYLVLETEAQGLMEWTPFARQLRLQAFSHLAAGACGVMYWHWHSIHHSQETYWKGVLSHDLQPNAIYKEACEIGKEFDRISHRLQSLQKKSKVAMLVSNESLTGIKIFHFPDRAFEYNDVVRWMYDALYEMNIEVDILFPEDSGIFSEYEMLLVPALYSASDSLLDSLKAYVENGGYLVSALKSGFSNEFLEVRQQQQPLPDCYGMHYDLFTMPKNIALEGEILPKNRESRMATHWMEMLRPETAEVLVTYDHPSRNQYAAVTKQKSGSGTAVYIGCHMEKAALKALLQSFLKECGLWTPVQNATFPIVIRSGINAEGRAVHFYMNFSGVMQKQEYYHSNATEILCGKSNVRGDIFELEPWGVCIFEEDM